MDMGTILAVLGILLAVVALPWVAARIDKTVRRWHHGRTGSYPNDAYLSGMSPVERLAKDRLYYFPKGWVNAVRLWGADADFVSASRLVARYTHELLVVPDELVSRREEIIQQRQREARENGRIFFDGPNTRLLDWRVTASERAGTGRELTQMELDLGPVGWYDFEYLNDAFRNVRSEAGLEAVYEYYVGISKMLKDGTVRHSKLSNMLDSAVTLVANDGFVGYQERSNRVGSVPGRLTSAVAENINRYLDDTDPSDVTRVFHGELDSAPSHNPPGNDYIPVGVPHPLSAVRRGVRSEISPRVADVVSDHHIKLIGLSFDLEALHPDALWAVFVDLPHNDILQFRRLAPGKEHIEGDLRFTPSTFESENTLHLLADERWIPAGKASCIRTIELIDAVRREKRAGYAAAFQYFREAD
jgi:hypothetical protein